MPRQPPRLPFVGRSRRLRRHRRRRRRRHSSKPRRVVRCPAPSAARTRKAQMAAVETGVRRWAVIAAFAVAGIGFDIKPSGTLASSVAGRGSDAVGTPSPPEQSSGAPSKVPASRAKFRPPEQSSGAPSKVPACRAKFRRAEQSSGVPSKVPASRAKSRAKFRCPKQSRGECSKAGVADLVPLQIQLLELCQCPI